jgi:SAM-dependent methyltransferase
MNKNERKAVLNRYNKRLQKFGYSNLTLGWGKKDRSDLRFEIFKQAFNFKNSKILDFGCGFGDFYGYLRKNKIKPKSYLGIDINQNLINMARNLYPEAKFLCDNNSEKSFELENINNVDYVVSSGVFNFKLSKHYDFIESCFDSFNKMSKSGFICNFISDKISKNYFPDKNINYNSPEKILGLAYKFSNNIILRNDYMPYEFTIVVRKDIMIDEKLTVYENNLKYVNKKANN